MPSLQAQKIAQLTGHNASIFALAADSDPQYFLSAAGDGWVVRWDLANPAIGKLIAKVETQIFSLLNVPDFHKLVVGNMNGGVHWVDLENPEATKNIAHHQKGVFDILRIGENVFTIGGEGMITRWSVGEGRSLESLHLSNQSLRSVDVSTYRSEIAIGASDNSIYILDANSLALKKTIKNAHENSVFTVQFSPDGRYLLSGGRDAHLKIWDAENDFGLVNSQAAHWFTINDIAFHPDGHWFATASRDKTIKIWDAQTFELRKVLDTIRDGCHVNSVNRLLWLDEYLISCSDDRSIILWRIS
jgi:WD40 repeat protein